MEKFKEKAEQLKAKAMEAADKAKNYDYKAKAEEIKETVANYDYKEKAKEVTENVKNFDYEGKAKEISETVKNYDYKGEVENIKKGGFKYFWSKHKKLSVAILAIAALCIMLFVNMGSSKSGYKTNLSDKEIINCARIVFEANTYSNSTPQFVGGEVIGQDEYGRCAAILEYETNGITGVTSWYVFCDGIKTDDTINTQNAIVEQSMNNSSLRETTIKVRKEQFGWDTPRDEE